LAQVLSHQQPEGALPPQRPSQLLLATVDVPPLVDPPLVDPPLVDPPLLQRCTRSAQQSPYWAQPLSHQQPPGAWLPQRPRQLLTSAFPMNAQALLSVSVPDPRRVNGSCCGSIAHAQSNVQQMPKQSPKEILFMSSSLTTLPHDGASSVSIRPSGGTAKRRGATRSRARQVIVARRNTLKPVGAIASRYLDGVSQQAQCQHSDV
jgi:hypothetical protein